MTSNDPYPGLRPQRPVRVATRPTPWPMIVGIGVLALLVGVVLAIVLGDDGDRGAGASPDGSPSASASASASGSASESASPSSSASASASASGTPGATPSPLALDTIVATTVDGLSVRRDPGRSAERLGTLAAGSESFVVQGPTDADGFAWYLVSGLGLPPATGCTTPETDPYNCPGWFGWVAAADEGGEPWLQAKPPDCPAAPLTAEGLMLARTNLLRLACFAGEPFTFRAWWPTLPEDGGLGGACAAQDRPSGWLLCQNINYNQLTINESEGFGGIGARVSIGPASGLSMPARGTWVEVRVHLDDPAAQGCADGADAVYEDPIAEQAILNCRAEMVLEAVTVVDGP